MSKEVKKWNAIIEQYKASGLSQVEFCKEYDISRHQFQYRWCLYNRSLKSGDTFERCGDNALTLSVFDIGADFWTKKRFF